MCMALGGRAAEAITFNKVTTGTLRILSINCNDYLQDYKGADYSADCFQGMSLQISTAQISHLSQSLRCFLQLNSFLYYS